MNNIKPVVSVIKILERTIGILENCNDIGEISDSTRKRVIEMLNKATLEVYFLDEDSPNVKPEKEQSPETPEIPEVVKEVDKVQPAEKFVIEESVPEEIPAAESIEIITKEEEILTEEDFVAEEDDNEVIENVSEENEANTVTEDEIFIPQDNLSDKPLFEWETEIEIADTEPLDQKTQENDINLLKLQLEEEMQRLEQDLQNWQDEKRKRDEEILATAKLLESLQQQTALNRAKQQSVAQQPQQPAKTEPHIKREPIKKEETQETLIDRFIGTKKVLHENFETDNMVNQISTPVASLSKAIGINDRFRFIKELFGGDSDLYNETIKRLDTIGSLVSAIAYIESNFAWDKNSDSVKQLISLIRRRYM
jgi:hypothetical protein